MNEFLQSIETFAMGSTVWVYLFIFFGKILEVTASTLRNVLINRGERLKGSLIAIVEVSLWITITGTVLVGFKDDLLKVVIFAIAFSIGNYLGSWMEDKLAFGLCSIQVIVPEGEEIETLTKKLRDNNFALTSIKGKGKDGQREIMYLHIKRKRIKQATAIIKKQMDKAVIIISDAKIIHGGFVKK